MHKKIVFFITALSIAFSLCLSAQQANNHKIDSLENNIQLFLNKDSLQHALTDLHDLSDLYQLQGDWDNYHKVVDRMIIYSKKIKDNTRLLECYNKLGISCCLNGRNKKALEYFNQTMEIAIETNDSVRISNAHENLGMTYKDIGSYEDAISHQIKSLEIRKAVGHERIFNNYMSLSLLYGLLKDPKKQDLYINLAKEQLKLTKEKNFSQLAIFNNELGDIYEDRSLYDSSINCYKRVILYSEKIVWKRGVAVGLGNLAGIYMEIGEFEKAINIHRKCLNLSLEINDCMGIAEEYLYLAELFIKTNKIDSAFYLNSIAIEKAKACDIRKELANALQQQATIYKLKGNFKLAYKYLEDYHLINDSLTNLENQSNIAEIETKFQSKEKEQQIELLNAKNIVSERQKINQKIIFFIITFTLIVLAITFYYLLRNNKKITKELKKINDLKSSFFSNVSHELRTPLTLIGGPATSLLKDETDNKKKQHLELIQHNSQKLLNLVNQLLDLSKIDAGFYSLNASEANLAELSKKIVSEFEYLAKSKNIKFTTLVPDKVVGFFDFQVVETILINLLSNAFKYVNNYKKVVFELTITDEKAYLSIKNSCDPISKEKINKMFDRFYRSDSLELGTGIGLSLVKELIGIYRASIKAYYNSTNEMQIDIELPISKKHFSEKELIAKPRIQNISNAIDFLVPNAFESNDAEVEIAQPTLLVVEDNTDMRNYIVSCFADHYSIFEAANGLIGVELACKHLPDIIISDVMMPKLDGIALCNQLKNNQNTSHIPIILLTAKAGEENSLIGLQNKANDYITKPFSSDNLVQKVKNALEHNLKMRQKYSQELLIKPLDLIFPSSEEQFAKNIQTVLNQHLTNPEFNVELFCETTNLSRTQLHRKITALTGLSATAFIRTQRVKLAAEKLKSENCNITDACYSVGFNDTSYFSKCFKEIIGETPSDYQLQLTDLQ